MLALTRSKNISFLVLDGPWADSVVYRISNLMEVKRHVLFTLILISALGVIAIPFGSPKFIGEAIAIELSFVTLSVLVWRG